MRVAGSVAEKVNSERLGCNHLATESVEKYVRLGAHFRFAARGKVRGEYE